MSDTPETDALVQRLEKQLAARRLDDAEIERLREDAERYRWLRSYRGSSIDSVYNYGGNEELDGVIDAARKKK
jgi:hypothetical protein